MPYIKQKHRDILDPDINELAHNMSRACPGLHDDADLSGPLNYTITRLLIECLNPMRYDDYNRIIGILACVQQEFYRKAIVPYEDSKANDVGDIDWKATYSNDR